MISSREASVTPEHDLAYLALVSSKDEAEENVRDIATVGLPPLITIDKSRPEDDMTLQMDIDTDMGSGSAEVVDDNASEITLVEKVDIQQQDGDFVMVNDGYEIKVQGPAEDKENQPPKSVSFMVNAERPILQDVDMNGGDQAMDYDSIDSIPDLIGPTLTPPQEMSDVPPPIPPRPRNTPKEPDTSLMFGRQQDVAECIENVMFQIEAAVKGTAFDENGEQIDLVKT